ncbi:SR-related and CTD-associated factor 4 isoform X2 [Teleopsis dalmanni]|uniref:SR-related and CTD-associated factor 4 isoform X2 n=1 Tax=Teleopsis dalmanni TaxID=139649 RepID=UPI0018CE1E2C|nr:SR-related and CTD-associated factor 4 isoform X2 [Teleopsis dalmanni]
MENVVAFNSELSGLYDSKPPISKAKMAAITKSAMRAIKFYKHVVQSVEKFILKCRPEYKVPGLYVIDSIVRQSRHQYGPEKDVFAPRFARNIKETFANLFRCAPEDKSRIIRVLNLWQKNNVFAPEVIQPIFDLADPNHPIYQMPPAGSAIGPGGIGDMSSTSNGLNTSTSGLDISMSGVNQSDDKIGGLPDLSNNNIKQLLNDPNVLRQLQTLQNFQKFKQQEDKHKNDLRMQEEAFMQTVLKTSATMGSQDGTDLREVEFVSEEQSIEVINLDGNDSRSTTPDRDRYKRRRSRTRSRSIDRRGGGGGGRDRRRRSSRSRSRTRSPRSNRRRSSRDRDRSERSNRDKEKDREHERERRKKGLPDIKKEHLSVCSTTLWVGHLSKLVYPEELSDTFGAYGDIVTIDQIVPRGCAFIVMNRRQDAFKAMQALKNHKLQGRAITISWAAGKGVKSKDWKDYWDLDLGVSYIPWSKLDENIDFDSLEEGGMFDEDTMPGWIKDKINHMKSLKEKSNEPAAIPTPGSLMFGIDTTQPPPGPPPTAGPPPIIPMVPGQFSMAPPIGGPPRMLGPMGMAMPGIPMPPNLVPGMPPPPHAMMMAPNMIPPGFPPIPPPVGAGAPLASHMGLPPTQFPPPPNVAPASIVPPPSGVITQIPSDDHMDIEMDEDENSLPPSTSTPQINFNQPPPIITPGLNNAAAGSTSDIGSELFSRDRTRGNNNASSRWGGRGNNEEDDIIDGPQRWRENGGPSDSLNYNENRGGPRSGGIGMSIPSIDMSNLQHRAEFLNEFDNRNGGPRGGGPRGNSHGGDFYPNMQNRFNQPTSLMQMRIPPPNAFNPRIGGPGGPPIFMRGQGGGPGGRQQGPGFFNPRNPFDRDNNRGPHRGGRGGGGSSRGGRGNGLGMQNWSDEEIDDSNAFKRRNQVNNRFRDGPDDRHNRDRGNRRGFGDRGGHRDWHDRDYRDMDRDRNRGNRQGAPHRRFSRDNSYSEDKVSSAVENNPIVDTEDDWDLELKEYDASESEPAVEPQNMPTPTENTNETTANIANRNDNVQIISNEILTTDFFVKPDESDDKKKDTLPLNSTPLYDELPAPVAVQKENMSSLKFDTTPTAEPVIDHENNVTNPEPTPTTNEELPVEE